MYLKHIDITGFRGINQLSLRLRQNMVLIGENAWGKSSLLDVLSVIFNLEGKLYSFKERDFHIRYQQTSQKCQQINLVFTFCEEYFEEYLEAKHSDYKALFSAGGERFHHLYLNVVGQIENENIVTTYQFLNENGSVINVEHSQAIARKIIRNYPVFRMRDARLNREEREELLEVSTWAEDEVQNELNALAAVLKYYFLTAQSRSVMKDNQPNTTLWWNKVKSLCLRLRSEKNEGRLELSERVQQHLASLFILKIREETIEKPIVLFEDLSAQLHPRMVAIVWELLSLLPLQRITTTNSMELVSQVPLKEICRFVRYPEHTQAYLLEGHSVGKDDLRKLTFHIHHNRGLALFARAWILVEGETEVWILSELAKLLNINLDMEGIKIVEFAQCGLRPLIKYAKAMGIEWYVLTDGDEAGVRYAETARKLNDDEFSRLTYLPQRDIEHFFYRAGLRDVFVRLANWTSQTKYPMSQIIKRAISHSSKPDLAIAISSEIQRRGNDSVPRLMKTLFANVLVLIHKSQAV